MGRLLARRLGRPLLDIDALVVQEAGASIPELFTRHGEAAFRDLESRVLEQAVCSEESAVIATGGGIVVREENRRLMAERGVRLYLHTDPTSSLERLLAQQERARADLTSPEVRPLLSGPDPLQTLQNLYMSRRAWYEEAELTCATQGRSAEQVVEEIIAMLTDAEASHETAPIVRRVHIGAGYDIVVDWGGLERLPQYLTQLALPRRVFLFTDSNLRSLYGDDVIQNLARAGFDAYLYTVPAGESSKSFEQLQAIYDWLLEHHAERREPLIALGGGVIGDLVGFVAATYLRGVPLIQVPTSLLSQVDAAIGGKTGINHSQGKNLIGAFYHPLLVLVDPATLRTLPLRERTEGWAEVVKYGIILDAKLFALLETYKDALGDFSSLPASLLMQIIARSIDLKVQVIEEDEKESGLRAILNYGHTVAHALESVAGYGELLHGEAVSLGMVAAAALAQEAGMLPSDEVQRQNALLEALGLPVAYQGNVRAQAILAKIQLDKKVVSKRVRWIMPRHIGDVVITEMPDELVERVISTFFAEARV
ncbi:hypothetical protein KSX_12480 [Ktedonospora formicarum]|uniref:Multifunctional fusion protein n=1 Tax=Ktedonospora formicarum TaxID=2778364 RepID=A0A8J3MS86_9CHLR|nr:hypothetical protein KSX_12480 [Ktedonospora formicarum]